MSEHESEYGREVRDTIVKSSLTGVVATAIVATALSPAGFGGMIGVAQGFGSGTDAGAQSNDAYSNLPPFPAPLSAEEVGAIQSQLARTAASLEITRAATEEKIDHIRNIALSGGAVTFEAPRAAPARSVQAAPEADPLRLTLSAPQPVAEVAPQAQPQPAAEGPGGPSAQVMSYREQHLEFADLLLSY